MNTLAFFRHESRHHVGLALLCGVAGLGIWLASFPVSADIEGTAAEATPARVQQLIEDLDSNQRRIRMTAEAQLLERGETVLPVIREALQKANSGVRESLLRIQQTLQIRAAEQSLRGTRISFATHSLKNAVESISSQSGTSVELNPGGSVTTQAFEQPAIFENQLFWNVLETICERARAGWEWNEERHIIITRKTQPLAKEHLFAVGKEASECFQIQAALAAPQAGVTNVPLQTTWRLTLRMDAEAPVIPLYAIVRDADFKLSSKQGTYPLFSPDARREVDFTAQTVTFFVDFNNRSSDASPPEQLQGVVRVRCAAGLTDLKFPLRGAALSSLVQSAGRNQAQLLSAVPTSSGIDVTLQVTFPPNVTWESHRVGLLHQQAWLTDAAGRKTGYRSLDVRNESTQTHEVCYHFPPTAGPASALTLNYRLPALYTIVPLPFEIECDVVKQERDAK